MDHDTQHGLSTSENYGEEDDGLSTPYTQTPASHTHPPTPPSPPTLPPPALHLAHSTNSAQPLTPNIVSKEPSLRQRQGPAYPNPVLSFYPASYAAPSNEGLGERPVTPLSARFSPHYPLPQRRSKLHSSRGAVKSCLLTIFVRFYELLPLHSKPESQHAVECSTPTSCCKHTNSVF